MIVDVDAVNREHEHQIRKRAKDRAGPGVGLPQRRLGEAPPSQFDGKPHDGCGLGQEHDDEADADSPMRGPEFVNPIGRGARVRAKRIAGGTAGLRQDAAAEPQQANENGAHAPRGAAGRGHCRRPIVGPGNHSVTYHVCFVRIDDRWPTGVILLFDAESAQVANRRMCRL